MMQYLLNDREPMGAAGNFKSDILHSFEKIGSCQLKSVGNH